MRNEKEDTSSVIDNETIKKVITSLVPSFIIILIKKQITDTKFTTNRHFSMITLPNKGVSKTNKVFDNTTIRNSNENTPNITDNEIIRNRKFYTMNHDCAVIKIANVNHIRIVLSSNNTYTNEHQYSTNKNYIDIMGRITYSKTSIYNSEK